MQICAKNENFHTIGKIKNLKNISIIFCLLPFEGIKLKPFMAQGCFEDVKKTWQRERTGPG
jgi:hypothetical protein